MMRGHRQEYASPLLGRAPLVHNMAPIVLVHQTLSNLQLWCLYHFSGQKPFTWLQDAMLWTNFEPISYGSEILSSIKELIRKKNVSIQCLLELSAWGCSNRKNCGKHIRWSLPPQLDLSVWFKCNVIDGRARSDARSSTGVSVPYC